MKKNIGKLEVREVNVRMKKACEGCGDEPFPRRLDITIGAGKWQTTKTLCPPCGKAWIQELRDDLAEIAEGLDA